MLTSQQWAALAREVGIPPRELRVAKLLAAGLSEKAIARRLALSQHTVHTYIRNLCRRLEVHSRAEFFICLLSAAS